MITYSNLIQTGITGKLCSNPRAHLGGKFFACLCAKILKYTKYSCDFGTSTVKKFARQSDPLIEPELP